MRCHRPEPASRKLSTRVPGRLAGKSFNWDATDVLHTHQAPQEGNTGSRKGSLVPPVESLQFPLLTELNIVAAGKEVFSGSREKSGIVA